MPSRRLGHLVGERPLAREDRLMTALWDRPLLGFDLIFSLEPT